MNRFFIIAFTAQLAAPDHWFSADKTKHFFLGAFVQSASFGALRAASLGWTPSLIGASLISASAIGAKEVRDRGGKGTPSAKDALWGLAGAAAISPVLARTR
jgi:hypothetical protein